MSTIVTRTVKGAPLSWAEADANFTNLNTDKAELASPTFTGTPAAPTATTGTNTTQLATTAFVQGKTATQTPFTATGNIVATNVQSAIAEVDAEKVAKSGDTLTGQLKGITPVSADDLTRKDYVDTMLPKAGGTMTGNLSVDTATTAQISLGSLGYIQAHSSPSTVELRRGLNNELIKYASGAISILPDASHGLICRTSGYVFEHLGLTTTTSGANAFFEWTGSSHDLRVVTSSQRYKKDIEDTVLGLDDLNKLRVVTFRGKFEEDQTQRLGFIAEEVDSTGLSILVKYQDGDVQAVHHDRIGALAVKAIQELSTKLDAALLRISELEAK